MNTDDLVLFAQVVEAGSFAEVARARRTSRAIVSKRIQRLEQSLGVRLLQRNTRRMAPTDAGDRIFEHALRLRDEVATVTAIAEAAKTTMSGTLRITAAAHFGHAYVQPVASEFVRKHPALRVELWFEDQTTDLVGGAFDLAFRIGHPNDSALVARRLGDVAVVVCAAPDYLKRAGTPKHPRDLTAHTTVAYASKTVSVSTWHFREANRDTSISVRPRLTVDGGNALLQAVLDGVGIGLLPRFMAAQHLRSRHLRELFSDLDWPAYAPVFAIYPARRQLPKKTRDFLEAVAKRVREQPLDNKRQPNT